MKAFPWLEKIDSTDPTVMNPVSHGGMDLRDYFAATVIPSLGWAGSFSNKWSRMDDQVYAERAYEIADAMMKAREQ